MRRRTFTSLLLLAALPLWSGCAEDDAEPIAPVIPETGGELFQRYVAIGNSITAGIQSAGINDSTQALAYPSLIAAAAGAEFVTPDFAFPGCPPPLVGAFPLTQQRVGGPEAPLCSLRESLPPGTVVQNLAVPGADISDALDALGNPDPADNFNRFQLFVLGGRTMVDALVDADPTLVTVALGSGDALGAATEGDAGRLTPLNDFRTSAEAVAAAIAERTDAEEAVFLGVFNPALVPFLQPGAFYFALRQAGQLPKPVSPNCAPGTPTARNIVSFNAVLSPAVEEISCADDAPFVLSSAEFQLISQRVSEFNAELARIAQERGFLFVDVNQQFLPFLQDPDAVRKCQGLATATNADEFRRALVTTCPNPSAPNFFGALFSFDAIHPSSLAHRVIANAVIGALNAERGLDLPLLPVPEI